MEIDISIIRNDKNELVPAQVKYRWHDCTNYRKLIATIRKDCFSVPFLDQMLKRLATFNLVLSR